MSIPDEKLEGARDYYEWFLAYLEAGFSEQQAMAILTRSSVILNAQTQYPPELYEFWERQNAVALSLQDELSDE